MTQANEAEKTIAKKEERVGNTNLFKTLGLYLKGDKILFRANFSSPEPNDVSYSYYYEFSLEEYRRGIRELREKGECLLIDTRSHYGGELSVLADKDGKSVSFRIPLSPFRTNDLYPSSFSTDWTIEQISLP
jgi:hypothetical protein